MALNTFLGPVLLAHLLNYWLFGILTVQVYLYYIAFPKDRITLKIFTFVAFVVELAQIVIASYDAYRMLANGWGNQAALDDVGLYWVGLPLMTAISGLVWQMFYTWRIHILSESLVLGLPIVLLSVSQLILGMYASLKVHAIHFIPQLRPSIVTTLTEAWLALAIACNCLITCLMFYHLLKAKNVSQSKRTTAFLSRMIMYTVETGAATMALYLLVLILFKQSKTELYVIPLMMTSKVYSNSLLMMLNARINIEGGRNSRNALVNPFISLRPTNLSIRQSQDPTSPSSRWVSVLDFGDTNTSDPIMNQYAKLPPYAQPFTRTNVRPGFAIFEPRISRPKSTECLHVRELLIRRPARVMMNFSLSQTSGDMMSWQLTRRSSCDTVHFQRPPLPLMSTTVALRNPLATWHGSIHLYNPPKADVDESGWSTIPTLD
ncbi:hypothetical protein EIP91_006086 [Steccherinum ochraceum]|uniref:DUF6534 domain-containing protein n=1 Tax=Steccherinum ochraceum TaxID=92696 RepID=A0A4R0R915_9APHY|nr:hypothetical protein EIP91_006086 [Steccherinum ochraceum]